MANKRVVIEYKKQKVKFSLQDLKSLLRDVKNRLKPDGAFRLEYFDEAYKDWISISSDDDFEDISEKSKLRVVLEDDNDVDPADFYFPDYDGEKFDVESLLKKAKTVSKKENKKQINNSKRYPLKNWGQSQALIFNFMFSNTRHDREGANHDTTYLEKLLTFLGFQVQSVDNDQTEENMNKMIKQFLNSREVALAPMVLLFIGSHGKQVNGTDYFWDANMKPVSVTSIVDIFATNKNFTALQEISEEKVKSDSMEESFEDWYKSQIPSSDGMEDDLKEKLSDMFLAYATLPNLKAYRDKGDGSWFVKSICKVFIENSFKDEYKKMFEEVNRAVKEKNFKKYIQMCDLKNGLKKSLYFYPQ